MASDATEFLTGDMNSININGKEQNGHAGDNTVDNEKGNTLYMWGFPVDEIYRLALQFFKDKDGTKAMALSYKDKLRLVACTRQVTYGQFRADIAPQVGFLDVVGNDRRLAWQSLGDLGREAAMKEFVSQLDALCPLFRPYIKAHQADKEEQERLRQEEEDRRKSEEEERQRQSIEEELKQTEEQQKNKQVQQEAQIRAALNQQTAIQFRQYAEQQFPSNPEQQEVLIRQLQEQHFHQYMQQVYQQQLLHQQQQFQQLQAMAAAGNPNAQQQLQHHVQQQEQQHQQTADNGEQEQPGVAASLTAIKANLQAGDTPNTTENQQLLTENQSSQPDSVQEQDDDLEQNQILPPPIAAPSMWTRKDLKEFKESLRKDPDSVIKVGSGETVTVRVPTHEDGTCLFWEFATDSYDLGFGVYFEWTIAPSNQVSVHVSESSDEEDLEDEEGTAVEGRGDVEKGGESKKDNRPPTDEIIPVYRRDCHEEVYCGSHMYPGRGVYLLKFDNSYSLWRSKTLYYRVYYTR